LEVFGSLDCGVVEELCGFEEVVDGGFEFGCGLENDQYEGGGGTR
jgi:hypothetical protein